MVGDCFSLENLPIYFVLSSDCIIFATENKMIGNDEDYTSTNRHCVEKYRRE